MINTLSAWNYGHTITKDNKYLNFSEVSDGLERVAILNEGAYTLEQFAIEIVRAMNDGAEFNEYSVSVDRVTRKITITADTENFSLLTDSGTQLELSPFVLAGFEIEGGSDLEGSMSYQGENASGEQFIPQFKLQQFVQFDDSVDSANVNINENTTGDVVEVVNFGDIKRMECNIMFQTSIPNQKAIRNDPQGKEKLQKFMDFCRTKGRLEFIVDVENPQNFNNCFLEKTRQNTKGTGFKLIDMVQQGWTNYFMTDVITFREI